MEQLSKSEKCVQVLCTETTNIRKETEMCVNDKKHVPLLLAVSMIISMLPITSFAETIADVAEDAQRFAFAETVYALLRLWCTHR